MVNKGPFVYVVVKRGVFLHDMFGPFRDTDEAKAKARDLARNDSDSYHNWEVHLLTKHGLGDIEYKTRKKEAEHEST